MALANFMFLKKYNAFRLMIDARRPINSHVPSHFASPCSVGPGGDQAICHAP